MSIQLTPQQLQILGLDQAPKNLRDDMVFKIGKGVFDATVTRLLSDLNEDQIHALNYAIENTNSFDDVMEYMKRTYPNFDEYMKEEQELFTAAFVEHLQNA
jgi:2-succinyl-5-enolpyruvyl-6-hydroxy-3-cyclohexene-1-carboxylate synthase